jgi:RNA polymerase primary sigma factor
MTVIVEAEKIEKAYKELKDTLTPKEREVIMRFYGIEKVRHSLAEIAEIYGVTRERIRQIKSEALIKLKINK